MNIKDLIPQREPFLFVDEIIEFNETQMTTQVKFKKDLEFFKGHFPGNPIVPGVILCEHCFQSGAALISTSSKGEFKNNLAVVSRVQNAKFKNIAHADETVTTKTELIERIDNAAFFKSVTTNKDNKKILIIEFACTLVNS